MYTLISDATNDRRSLERRLQDSLYLIVKRNRADFSWQFPQGKVLDDETTLRMVRVNVFVTFYPYINDNCFCFVSILVFVFRQRNELLIEPSGALTVIFLAMLQ